MKQHLPLLGLCVALIALCLLALSSSRVPHRPAAAASPAPAASPSAAVEGITAAEAEVLVMYDEMALAFEQPGLSCDAVATALEQLVEAHKEGLARLRNERTGFSEEQLAAAQARVVKAQGERMRTMSAAFQRTILRCKDDARLGKAMRLLAATSTPARASP